MGAQTTNMHAKPQRAFLSAIVIGRISCGLAERRLSSRSSLAARRDTSRRTLIAWRPVADILLALFLLSTAVTTLCMAQEPVSILHGTVRKIDQATRTLTVRTADGADHTLKVSDQATIHGTKDGFDGLRQGSDVVVRTTAEGTETIADDLGRLGKDGMSLVEGTIVEFDQKTKTITVKDPEGTQNTFEYTDEAANDLSKVVVRGAERGARVTVYYTEDGSKKLAYFFAAGHRQSRPNPLAR
jgi:hypothetical protein